MSITAGIRSRELCQAPISASIILSLAGVVGGILSFSTLQMQRRLHPDSNVRLEGTYRHSHSSFVACLSERRHRGRLSSWNQTFSILLTLNPLPAAIIAFAVALITPKGLFSSLLKEIQFVMSSKKECFNFVIQRGSWKPTKNVYRYTVWHRPWSKLTWLKWARNDGY